MIVLDSQMRRVSSERGHRVLKVEGEICEQLGEGNTLRLEAQGQGDIERPAYSEHKAVPRGQDLGHHPKATICFEKNWGIWSGPNL